jgi:hypothetical protein
MTTETIIENALSPRTENGVSRAINENQATSILIRAKQIQKEMRRANRIACRYKQEEIDECWDWWDGLI